MDGELDSAVDVQALSINKIARETLVNFMANHDQLRDLLATFLVAYDSAKRLKTLWGLPVRRMTAIVPRPAAVASTISARQSTFRGVLRSATRRSSRARCSGLQ